MATAASLASLPRRRQVRPPRRGIWRSPSPAWIWRSPSRRRQASPSRRGSGAGRRALSCGFSPRPTARTRPLPGTDPASLPGPPLGRVSHARRWCGGSKQRTGQGPVARRRLQGRGLDSRSSEQTADNWSSQESWQVGRRARRTPAGRLLWVSPSGQRPNGAASVRAARVEGWFTMNKYCLSFFLPMYTIISKNI